MAVRECKNCKSYKSGACTKKKLNVSINATWCKDYEINVCVGQLVTVDLDESTMLFKVDEETVYSTGKYAIVPIEKYNNLINQ